MSSSSNILTNPKLSCGICSKTIAKNHRFIHCELCNVKVHIKCDNTDIKTYNKIKTDNLSQTCTLCKLQNIPLLTDSTENNPTITIPKINCGICKKNNSKKS